MDSQLELVRHVSLGGLKRLIRKEKDERVLRRLLFILQLYRGDDVVEASARVCVAKQTGYDWLRLWNEGSHDGLRPRWGGGRPSRLTPEQKAQLKARLESKANWLTTEVRALIQQMFGVIYCTQHVARMLRGFGMHYAKPYPHDYRRPEDAEAQLAQSLKEALEKVSKDAIFGFVDQSSPQTADNKQRFWSFTKPRREVNTTKIRANTFGFYTPNGKDVLDFLERSTSPHVCRFLRRIREKNPLKDILLIWDNARGHIAAATRRYAASLNITLVFLPPYSPDLNPIEKIWKGIRRKISQIFVKNEWTFKETIRTTFYHLAKKTTYMQKWLTTFQPILSNKI